MNHIVRMCDLSFNPKLFETFLCGTALDELLSAHQGLPRGVNYMIIGDPGVGKTTIILDMLANMQKRYPNARILFVSAEMNEIDLTVYVERYPKFQTLPILFVESDFDNEVHNWEIVKDVVEQGWDIVAIDSFYELQGIIRDEENVRMKDAESWLLQLIKKQNKGHNSRYLNCTFLTIQQVTKSGNFVGSNRLKHSITAMMELRLENPRNEKEAAEKLIPYEEVRTAYETAEHYDRHKEHLMKGEGTIWNTYNVLTQFATHTPIWTQQDYRRINLMNEAVGLLKKKPDIVNYMDIF